MYTSGTICERLIFLGRSKLTYLRKYTHHKSKLNKSNPYTLQTLIVKSFLFFFFFVFRYNSNTSCGDFDFKILFYWIRVKVNYT